MSRRFLGPLLVGLLLLSAASAQTLPSLVYRATELPDGSRAHFLSVEPSHLRVLDARDYGADELTAEQFLRKSGADAIVNASFFDVDGSPMGLLVVDGERRNKLRPVDWGVFSIDATGAAVIEHTDAFDRSRPIVQAVQSGPRLVVDSKPLELKKQKARRTAVCTLDGGRAALVVVDDSVLASDLADWFAQQGCTDALNLDGGPSTQLYLERAGVVVDVPGGTPVPVALGVFAAAEADLAPGGGCGCR
ncbi:MAG: phosphodiester glycosidase family protein [Proteobacteria bacterium]|nr:phosphodiester glycosidase family protein [Pseudomonadota bacterium]